MFHGIIQSSYEMVYGKTPFVAGNRNAMFKNICEGELKFPASPLVSDQCKDLLSQLLKKVPVERLGAKGDA